MVDVGFLYIILLGGLLLAVFEPIANLISSIVLSSAKGLGDGMVAIGATFGKRLLLFRGRSIGHYARICLALFLVLGLAW